MEILTQSQADSFGAFISAHDFFYIIGHKEPDGDCIASCLGIEAIIKHYKKDYQLLSAGPFKRIEIQKYEPLFTDTMDFMDESERKRTGLIITDCSELSRLGEIDGDLENLDTYIIDHHRTSGLFKGATGYINPDAPACAYLVQLFHEKLIGPVSAKTAEILMLGICTDTGFFRFLATKPEDADLLAATGRLVTAGADLRKIYNSINNGKPYSTRKLLGILLGRAKRYLDGRLVITYETMEDTIHCGQEGRDSDALYQLLLSSKNVEAAVFLRQESENSCTGGFRSQDKIDVSKVAAKFGGGGHKNASGMLTDGKIDTLIPAIVKEFARIM